MAYWNNGGNGNAAGYGNGNSDDDLGMDLSQVRAWQDFEVLPPGEYMVYVKTAERKTSRAGQVYLSCSYGVMEGVYKSRVLFDAFFLWHEKNDVALAKFKALRNACGLNPNTAGKISELYDRSFIARVKVRNKRNSESERENFVSEYYPLSERQPQQSARPAQQMYQKAPEQLPKFIQNQGGEALGPAFPVPDNPPF